MAAGTTVRTYSQKIKLHKFKFWIRNSNIRNNSFKETHAELNAKADNSSHNENIPLKNFATIEFSRENLGRVNIRKECNEQQEKP